MIRWLYRVKAEDTWSRSTEFISAESPILALEEFLRLFTFKAEDIVSIKRVGRAL